MSLLRVRAAVMLVSLAVACSPAEQSLAPSVEHAHALRHNLTVVDDSVYRWSDPRTWPGGVIPGIGAHVVIPAGRRVLLDISPVNVRHLTISGVLEFADDRDLALSASAIDVQGALVIGRAKRRHQHRAVITLTGSATTNASFGAGGKGIIVTGGSLELHGAQVVSWTRLAQHAPAGASAITLERAPYWKAGDRIAIAATGFDPAESEDVEIAGVDGNVVRLTRPLAHAHWGERQTIAGRELDERAEVALLSRNIVIQGDSASDATDYGAQVMIHPGSVAHVEGVEFVRVGQRGLMGRYPLHWHLARDTEGHYARDNSVWRSYNRCMTIHGTNGVTLERNVCYDHRGHGFFLEDGVEHDNTLAGNLGFRTRAPDAASRLLASDERPATFWVTNPDNDLHDNVAGGSDGFGIWYALPEHPTGMSATTAVSPRHLPLSRFDNNTAHSNVLSGLWVDEGTDAQGRAGITWYEPTSRKFSGAPSPAVFRGLVAYKNQAHGAWFRGSNIRLVDAVLADNMSGATFAATSSTLEDAFVVGVSENSGVNPRAWAPVRGFWFYDGPVGVLRTTFANFDARAGSNASALGFHPVNPWPISAENWVEAVRFVDAVPVAFDAVTPQLDATKSAVVVDRDGSLGDAPRSMLVPDAPLLRVGCTQRVAWQAWSCSSAFTQLMLRADVSLVEAIAVQRVGAPESMVRVAPVRYDPRFTSLTVPLGVQLEARTSGARVRRLTLSTSMVSDSATLDLALPEWSSLVRVTQVGRTLRQVAPERVGECFDCWSEAPDGGVRMRLRASPASQAITVTLER